MSASIAVYALAVPLILLDFKRAKDKAKLMRDYRLQKEFIATAEADRINVLAEKNPSYLRLPYAYVFKLPDTWAKKLEPAPSWTY